MRPCPFGKNQLLEDFPTVPLFVVALNVLKRSFLKNCSLKRFLVWLLSFPEEARSGRATCGGEASRGAGNWGGQTAIKRSLFYWDFQPVNHQNHTWETQ